jgi:hypothetical protein
MALRKMHIVGFETCTTINRLPIMTAVPDMRVTSVALGQVVFTVTVVGGVHTAHHLRAHLQSNSDDLCYSQG